MTTSKADDSNDKASGGRFLEDFSVGEVIRHASPRTVTAGDVALYQALYGGRFAVQSSNEFARSAGYADAPVDDLLVYNILFGKTVPDVSLNSIAALGIADCRFLRPVVAGDTLSATSEVIGLRRTGSGSAGVVYIRTVGRNQRREVVLEMARWTMIRSRDGAVAAGGDVVPTLPDRVPPEALGQAVPPLNPYTWDRTLAGSAYLWGDYEPGERIDHIDGMTIEEAEHQMAARLYQNLARIHVNQHAAASGPFGRRLVYGGVVISVARALTFNGLANAFHISAINSGRHVAPVFAGDTIHAWSEVVERAEIPGRRDIGGLRVRTIATKNQPCSEFPLPPRQEAAKGAVALELDYWVVLPR